MKPQQLLPVQVAVPAVRSYHNSSSGDFSLDPLSALLPAALQALHQRSLLL